MFYAYELCICILNYIINGLPSKLYKMILHIWNLYYYILNYIINLAYSTCIEEDTVGNVMNYIYGLRDINILLLLILFGVCLLLLCACTVSNAHACDPSSNTHQPR